MCSEDLHTYIASNHLQCRSDLSSGCTRCIIQQPTICCELCSPSYFETVAHVSLEKSKNQPPRSTLPEENYKTNPCDMELRNALHNFCKTHTLECFGHAYLHNTGPDVIMVNDVLQRIVNCAHFYLIETAAQLAKETHWNSSEEFADVILDLINLHHPKLIAEPPLASVTNGPLPTPIPLIKPHWCKACKQEGHISE